MSILWYLFAVILLYSFPDAKKQFLKKIWQMSIKTILMTQIPSCLH